MLSLLHHSNLVTLAGYCTSGDQRLLVYEYMPMGSLEDHLFGKFLLHLMHRFLMFCNLLLICYSMNLVWICLVSDLFFVSDNSLLLNSLPHLATLYLSPWYWKFDYSTKTHDCHPLFIPLILKIWLYNQNRWLSKLFWSYKFVLLMFRWISMIILSLCCGKFTFWNLIHLYDLSFSW